MPNKDFNLDDLKKSWQEQKAPKMYDSSEIEAMLNKKSRNYVKYILWISITEFFLFALFNVYAVFFTPQNESLIDLLEKLGVTVTPLIESNLQKLYLFLKTISLGITGLFVYLFFKNYKKIRIENNLRNFISHIIGFKKIVKVFILTNILILIGFTCILTFFVAQILWFQHISLKSPVLLVICVGVFGSLLLGIALILLYYRIFYGTIMKRLGKNLQELEKIAEEKEM